MYSFLYKEHLNLNSRDHWYLEITSHRYEKKNDLMPSQPKLDLPKLRSQISRRADDSIRVFARPAWHPGHADREDSCVKFGMPGMPGMKLACPA